MADRSRRCSERWPPSGRSPNLRWWPLRWPAAVRPPQSPPWRCPVHSWRCPVHSRQRQQTRAARSRASEALRRCTKATEPAITANTATAATATNDRRSRRAERAAASMASSVSVGRSRDESAFGRVEIAGVFTRPGLGRLQPSAAVELAAVVSTNGPGVGRRGQVPMQSKAVAVVVEPCRGAGAIGATVPRAPPRPCGSRVTGSRSNASSRALPKPSSTVDRGGVVAELARWRPVAGCPRCLPRGARAGRTPGGSRSARPPTQPCGAPRRAGRGRRSTRRARS